MTAFTYLATQKDPALRPTKGGALTYFAGVLLTSGGLFQAYLGVQNSPRVWGLHGPPLTALGIVGLIAGFVIVGLAAYVSYGSPKSGFAGTGVAIIIVSAAGLFTSFLGFFGAGSVVGIVAGLLILRGKGGRSIPTSVRPAGDTVPSQSPVPLLNEPP